MNSCKKCGQPVPKPFTSHIDNLGGCPDLCDFCEENPPTHFNTDWDAMLCDECANEDWQALIEEQANPL
jgi:hypothetical protein